MSTYRTTILSARPPVDVFEYMARFSNAVEWDPGVLACEESDPGPPRRGSTYRLVVGALGRRVRLEYRIEEIDPPRRVVLRAENSAIRSTDVIEVSPMPEGGTEVSYEATLTAKGAALLLTPLVGVALRRIGDRAAAGLKAALAS